MASKSKSTVVGTAAIRAQFLDGTLTPAKGVSTASLFGANGTRKSPGNVRGRIHPAHVQVFLDANPGTVFGEGENAPAARTIKVPRKGANGRALSPVTLPVSEAKALAGVAGKRGRMSSAELEAAGAAYQKAQAKS